MVACVLGCVLAILILHGYVFWDHTAEDAFISFRYAQNLAHGNGLVWNPGERVEGYSNFLWVLILAGSEFVRLGIVEPSRWLGFAASCGTLTVMYLLARELTDDSRKAELTFAGAAVLLVSTAPFSLWTFAGLEEPLFTFLVALTLYLHIRERRLATRRPWTALSALAAALTRPEGIMIGALVLGLQLLPSRDERWDAERLKRIGIWMATLAVPYALFLIWRFSYYGYLLPNTYYQKLGGPGLPDSQRYSDGYSYVLRFWQQYGWFLLFPLPVIALLRRSSRAVAAPLLAFGGLWVAYVVYAGGDYLLYFRFLVPLLPLAYLLSVHVIILEFDRLAMANARRAATVVLPILLLATSAWLMDVPAFDKNLVVGSEAVAFQREEIAAWIRTQDPQAVVALNAAGQIPYWSKATSIDMLGLNDEHIAHRPPYSSTQGFLAPGHNKGDGRYVLQRRPDIIILTPGLAASPESAAMWRTARTGLAADNDLLDQPDLWVLYEPAWVKLPHGVFNFLRRKDSQRVVANASPAG